jgi:hypothetical protein
VKSAPAPIGTFAVLRWWPAIAVSYNTLFPKLVIGQEGIMLRVLRTVRFSWDEVQEIGVAFALRRGIIIKPNSGIVIYAVSFGAEKDLRAVVLRLKEVGAPLSRKALAFSNGEPLLRRVAWWRDEH